jgi:dimethylglycine dehydrogenase
MESLRIEKSYRMWGLDLIREYTALEAGLQRFVKLNKGEFRGLAALLKQQREGLPRRFATLEVTGIKNADPGGNEPIYRDAEMVGRATSGVYRPGHGTRNRNLGRALPRARHS